MLLQGSHWLPRRYGGSSSGASLSFSRYTPDTPMHHPTVLAQVPDAVAMCPQAFEAMQSVGQLYATAAPALKHAPVVDAKLAKCTNHLGKLVVEASRFIGREVREVREAQCMRDKGSLLRLPCDPVGAGVEEASSGVCATPRNIP